jgi:hypothetical protein
MSIAASISLFKKIREISPYPIHPSPLLVRLIITAETYKAALAKDRETGRADMQGYS